jgi:acetyltransferase-like isoleucine patch superfamily enzyme
VKKNVKERGSKQPQAGTRRKRGSVKKRIPDDRYLCIADDVKLGRGVKLSKFINLYGCTIGENTKIGAFVEVQKNATIGKNCKISSHTFICEGVTIEDDVFVGHSIVFINDSYPRATANGALQTEADWSVEPTHVKRGASIGSNCTVLSNVTIGERAIVGAGSVVTKDVPPDTIVAGNPARFIRVLGADETQIPNSKDQISNNVELSMSNVPKHD